MSVRFCLALCLSNPEQTKIMLVESQDNLSEFVVPCFSKRATEYTMPYDYRVFPEQNFVIARFFGTFTANDGVDWARDYFAHADFAPDQLQLFDWQNIAEFDATYASVAGMVRTISGDYARVSEGTLCVMHAPQDVSFGMARMYQQVADDVLPTQIEVARSEEEAFGIAGLDAQSFEEILPLAS